MMVNQDNLPDSAVVAKKSGDICFSEGKIDQAIDYYQEAIRLKSDYAEAYVNLGNIYREQHLYLEAEQALIKAVTLRPELWQAHCYLGLVYEQVNKPDQAVESYKQALRWRSSCSVSRICPETYWRLGNIMMLQGKYDEALHQCFKVLISHYPLHAPTHNNIGLILFDQHKIHQAMSYFKKAIESDRLYLIAYKNLGVCYQILGLFDEARACFERIIQIDSDYAEAYYGLVQTKKITHLDNHLIIRLKSATLSFSVTQHQKASAWFALGKSMDDLGKYDRAFISYKKANRLDGVNYKFNRDQLKLFVDSQIGLYSKSFVEDNRVDKSSESTPIFIIGMPRSGTTLINQILSNHPDASSAGEVNFFGSPEYAMLYQNISDETINHVMRQYMERVRPFCAETKYIIDKMPSNFLYLGLIHLCFPTARIIHCRRHPLDICLSIYFQRFPLLPYSYHLADIACYYERYEQLMAHWKQIFPECIIDIWYEDIVSDLEAGVKKILKFCNLDWYEDCLHFSNNKEAVFTASSWQVRQPLFQSSVNRWKNYAPYIQSLMPLQSFYRNE